MASYKELKAQAEKFERLAAEAMKRESGEAIKRVLDIIDEFGLGLDEIKLAIERRVAVKQRMVNGKYVPKAPGTPRYKDPETGATWTGKGKPPAWIVGKNRDDLLIKAAGSEQAGKPVKRAAKGKTPARPAAAKKAVGKATGASGAGVREVVKAPKRQVVKKPVKATAKSAKAAPKGK